jgi:archaellum component FlaC
MPNITAATEKEQLAQIRSYLYQFIPQLQWALNNIETASSQGYVVQQGVKAGVTSNTSASGGVVNFNDLKALIIKSADIVEAYYEEISKRLEGIYVAESDFGTFVEQTSQDIIANSTEIRQVFDNTQAIITDIEGIAISVGDINGEIDNINGSIGNVNGEIDTLNGAIGNFEGSLQDLDDAIEELKSSVETINTLVVEVNAHIQSGLLYHTDGGIPVYGLEIGQKVDVNGEEVFNKFARFTADRLSFYDQNDNEVAYVSDYKLYIRNVEITSSFKIGGFQDTVTASGDVVTKWVGGEG